MNKRLGAGLLAAASTASVLGVVAAQPAAAAIPCGTYPPGQAYMVSRAPESGTVARGSVILTRGTLRRSSQSCVGFPLGLYVKYDNVATYGLKGSGTTDNTGSVRVSISVPRTLRFFYNLRLSSTVSSRSATSEIKAR